MERPLQLRIGLALDFSNLLHPGIRYGTVRWWYEKSPADAHRRKSPAIVEKRCLDNLATRESKDMLP